MSKVSDKIDNTYFKSKVVLRENALNSLHKKEINVLDCFAGKGLLWTEIKRRHPNKTINVISIDKKKYDNVSLVGDNIRYLKSMNLTRFDIIDLDAYGVPYKQLRLIFEKHYTGTVITTFIQTVYGRLPDGLLEELGYPKKMVKKCPSLFFKNGIEKWKEYLAMHGVKKIKIRSAGRKHYMYFEVKQNRKTQPEKDSRI